MGNTLTYETLKPEDAKATRDFCLKIVKEVYNIDYRSDWHADLDSLLKSDGTYSKEKGGIFYLAKIGNEVVGTIGVRNLEGRTKILNQFKNRGYVNGKNIASIWRAYVKKDLRGQGIGKELLKLAEEFILDSGYKIIYLHTSWDNPDAVFFWQKRGFEITLEENDFGKTVHMEKKLNGE